MSMTTVILAIEGTRPLLFHTFSPDTLPFAKQKCKGMAGNDPSEWQRTVLMTADRQVHVPGTYFFSCLRNAAVYLKRSRSNLQKPVASTLQIIDPIYPIPDQFIPEEPQYIRQGQCFDALPPVYVDVSA